MFVKYPRFRVFVKYPRFRVFVKYPRFRLFVKYPRCRVFVKYPRCRVFVKYPRYRVFVKYPRYRVFVKYPSPSLNDNPVIMIGHHDHCPHLPLLGTSYNILLGGEFVEGHSFFNNIFIFHISIFCND